MGWICALWSRALNIHVEKMRFRSKDDKSWIVYNSQLLRENVSAVEYEYQVNGKSAFEWVMERYAVTTHKDSGIKNDPNDWLLRWITRATFWICCCRLFG